MNIRTEPWNNERGWPGLINHIFFYVHVIYLGKRWHQAALWEINVLDWFKTHDKHFKVLTWPRNAPDPNLIEHLCDVLEQVQSMEVPAQVFSVMLSN